MCTIFCQCNVIIHNLTGKPYHDDLQYLDTFRSVVQFFNTLCFYQKIFNSKTLLLQKINTTTMQSLNMLEMKRPFQFTIFCAVGKEVIFYNYSITFRSLSFVVVSNSIKLYIRSKIFQLQFCNESQISYSSCNCTSLY